MEAGLGDASGLRDADLDAVAGEFDLASERLRRRIESGDIGFWKLPKDASARRAVHELADRLAGDVREVLVLGIGGSSLGARALCEALGGAAPGFPPTQGCRVHFPDNSDPWLLSILLERLDPRETAVLVVSKSGGTVETTAQMQVVVRWLTHAIGVESTRRRVVAITDPRTGALRALAEREGWSALSIPENVGGRFSVLTAAGLLPALLAGVDVDALLAGAGAMATRCEAAALLENPAGLLATVHVLHQRLRGRSIHVMMPYADRLRAFAAWFVQLWAESLGKRLALDGRVIESGPTPLVAVGATDQHAQLQLFIEGPRDKLVTFIAVAHVERDLEIPGSDEDTRHLAGKTLGGLLRAQHEATCEALAADARPSLTVHLDRLDAHAFGELLFLYQAATAFAGELYGVNAFDQPGVALGKRLTDGLLGRHDSDASDAAAAQLRSARERRLRHYRV